MDYHVNVNYHTNTKTKGYRASRALIAYTKHKHTHMDAEHTLVHLEPNELQQQSGMEMN